ncbi:MAG: hypothetical protein HOP33_09030 [Verrucomicrobia bacterium]|nr:hypothetical protein [Verrucomicrobiota bacterium]
MKLIQMLIPLAILAAMFALFAWAFIATKNATPRRHVIGNANRKFFRAHVRKVYLAPLLLHKLVGWLPGQPRARGEIQFANIGEGIAPNGVKMFIPDAITTSRYLLYKKGSDVDHVAITTTGETPIGSSDDQVDDITVPLAINVFGAIRGTVKVVTDGTVADGNYVKCGTTGRVTAAVTTDVVIGKAVIGTDTTAAANDVIAIIPIMPGKHPF